MLKHCTDHYASHKFVVSLSIIDLFLFSFHLALNMAQSQNTGFHLINGCTLTQNSTQRLWINRSCHWKTPQQKIGFQVVVNKQWTMVYRLCLCNIGVLISQNITLQLFDISPAAIKMSPITVNRQQCVSLSLKEKNYNIRTCARPSQHFSLRCSFSRSGFVTNV